MLSQDMIDTLTTFFAWIDSDHDGFVTIDEIKTACGVDLDGDGVVSEAEKLACAKTWIETYVPLQDLDRDGRISLAELLLFNDS